jgi:hypothetical protein
MGLRFTGCVYIFQNEGGETKCDFCFTGGGGGGGGYFVDKGCS